MRILLTGCLLALSFSSAASASQNTSGNPTIIYGMPNGAIIFNQTGGARDGLPSCAAGDPDRWAFDASTAVGQNRLAILLTAKALYKSVQVYSNNSCSAWGDTETVEYLAMNN